MNIPLGKIGVRRSLTALAMAAILIIAACAQAGGTATPERAPSPEPDATPATPTPEASGAVPASPSPSPSLSSTPAPSPTAGPSPTPRSPSPRAGTFRQLLPRDAIRPIYDPSFVPASQADLSARELIIGVSLNGEAKAYPIGPLQYREIVNDTVGGVPVLVTW
ncbi:MAG: DUF3179 domain-containing protein [Chloroflexi bacterium]|nr:DUF3179 domain-containing protein [Chloroflexota bacterium]